jgi:hypothetical protein
MSNPRNQQTLPTPQPPADLLAAQTWMSAVVVPVVQNVAGGVGAFLVSALGLTIAGVELTTALIAALYIGGFVLGLFLIIRAFRDEVRFVVGTWAEHHDAARIADLAQRLRLAEQALGKARSENLVINRHEPREAAEALILAAYAGQSIARAESLARGMTRAGWDHGHAILIKAGVINATNALLLPDANTALAAVARHLAGSRQQVRTQDGDWTKV